MKGANTPSKAKPDKPSAPAPDTHVAEVSEETVGFAAPQLGPMGAAGDGQVQRQTTRLTDPRLRTAQRQQMAGQMGRVQGNRQLQRLVQPAPITRPIPTPAQSPPPAQTDFLTPENAAWSDVSSTYVPPFAVDAPTPQPSLVENAEPGTVQRERSWLGNAWDATTSAVSSVAGAIANPKEAALKAISGFAKNIPGYNLLGLILGKDPITDATVERSTKTIFQAVLGLVPGGSKLFESLDESGAIDKAFAWLEEQWAQLGLSWDAIKGLFKQAWDTLNFTEVLTNLSGTWEKLKAIFIGPINRIKTFVVSIGEKIMEFVFEGVMAKMGGGAVVGILKQAGAAFSSIIKDPIGFLGNLIKGIKQGFENFAGNIGTHIKKGLMSWLFGQMAATGIELPKAFDMKGILSLVMQVLGMTWQNLKLQATKVMGAGVVSKLEGSFEIFQIVKEQGIGGLWEYIKDQIGNLKETVLGGIKDMVITQVIQAGIKWLVSTLAGPAGAVIKAIETIYNVVMWVVNNAERLASLVSAVGNAISSIASGAVGAAANFIENALATAIPTVIGFLASLLGLGDFGSKISNLIEKVQQPVNKAFHWVIGKAKAFGAKVVGGVKGAFGKAKRDNTTENSDVKMQAHNELSNLTKTPFKSREALQTTLSLVLEKLKPKGLKSLNLNPKTSAPGKYNIIAVASPPTVVDEAEIEEAGDFSSEKSLLVAEIETAPTMHEAQTQIFAAQKEKETRLSPSSASFSHTVLKNHINRSDASNVDKAEALSLLDKNIEAALRATEGDTIFELIKEIQASVNRLVKGGSVKLSWKKQLQTHHGQEVHENPGTFPKEFRARVQIPPKWLVEINKWTQELVMLTKSERMTRRRELANLVRDSLSDEKADMPTKEGKLRSKAILEEVDMLVLDASTHSKIHRDREQLATKIKEKE